jgi:hypothetical protein
VAAQLFDNGVPATEGDRDFFLGFGRIRDLRKPGDSGGTG